MIERSVVQYNSESVLRCGNFLRERIFRKFIRRKRAIEKEVMKLKKKKNMNKSKNIMKTKNKKERKTTTGT